MKAAIVMLGEILLGVAIFVLFTGGVQTEVTRVFTDMVTQLKTVKP